MSVKFTPSTVNVPATVPLLLKVDCWPLSLPATLTRSTWTPGTLCSSTHGSRPVGMFLNSSLVMTAPDCTLRVSMTGVSLVTVTAAATVESFIVSRISVLRPRLTATFSRVTTANPARSSLTAYAPGERFRNRNSPRASVVTIAGAP